jgi:hypothetical protein
LVDQEMSAAELRAANFGQPAEVFGKFPGRDMFIAGERRGPTGGEPRIN